MHHISWFIWFRVYKIYLSNLCYAPPTPHINGIQSCIPGTWANNIIVPNMKQNSSSNMSISRFSQYFQTMSYLCTTYNMYSLYRVHIHTYILFSPIEINVRTVTLFCFLRWEHLFTVIMSWDMSNITYTLKPSWLHRFLMISHRNQKCKKSKYPYAPPVAKRFQHVDMFWKIIPDRDITEKMQI